ncbi:MAG: sigma-54 dependent transcriptional regulator [Bacteroidales bacterium]
MDNKVLIIDDEDNIRKLLTRVLELEGYKVCQAQDCGSAVKMLKLHQPDVALCDVFLPDGNGVEFVSNIKEIVPDIEVILLTAHGNIPDGVQAIKNGAFDYLTKGDDNYKIVPLLNRAMEKVLKNKGLNVAADKRQPYSFDSIIGNSPAIKNVINLAKKVSLTDVPVLLTGETGTGKEVFAQSIHNNSCRHNHPFVAINCSAFSKDLLESEMFGHKAGAFTGAIGEKKGLFEEADQGTIFLDEIGEMAFELQAKLLRILETGQYIKIGDTKPTSVNVRIIAATNRDLKKEISEGHFREDLFYRLSVFHLQLPSLRERGEDISLLADHFLKQVTLKLGCPLKKINADALKRLEEYNWRGNIRELRNVIERTLIICDGDKITINDLPVEIQMHFEVHSEGRNPSEFEMSQMEKYHILRVLDHTHGNKTEAARLMKIGLTTLYRKIEEYHI